MKKLQIYVCENFYPEYKEALHREGIDDIELLTYPALCDHKGRKSEAKEIFSQSDTENAVIICSGTCDALNLIDRDKPIETVKGNYCFTHLTSDEFLDYLTAEGSYIVSSGWLKQWENHICAMGFDKETARSFFQEISKKIVFLDARIDETAEDSIKELSDYLGLPYVIIPITLETIRLLIKSKLLEWRLHNQKSENAGVISELRSQSADYSAVFDMLGKISSYTNKRDVIGKVKDLFMMVFGAQNFRFWNESSELFSTELSEFKSSDDQYMIMKNEGRFYIKVMWDDYLYGILETGEFLFPMYIDKYLNLALDITKFIGLVLHNNEQYEKILKSEKELKHLSFHDPMTGLYNRTYINQLLEKEVMDDKTGVFMFDIDKLKYVNDNFGHAEGDSLINSFAAVLKKCFRETDVAARIGGDEFTAIIYDADEVTIEIIKQRIEKLIRTNNENLKDKHLELSVSVGCATIGREGETIESLMKKADILMYENKMKKRSAEKSGVEKV